MSRRTPITFEYKGERYTGSFDAVNGMGVNAGMWHLMINNYYQGFLQITAFGWFFYNNKDEFKELGDFFGEYMIAWYDSAQDIEPF